LKKRPEKEAASKPYQAQIGRQELADISTQET